MLGYIFRNVTFEMTEIFKMVSEPPSRNTVRVATNLENLEFSGNLKSLREFRENSGNFNVTQGIL